MLNTNHKNTFMSHVCVKNAINNIYNTCVYTQVFL